MRARSFAIAGLTAAGLSAATLIAAGASAQQGSERRDFDVAPFEAVRASGAHNVIIMPGRSHAVRAEGSAEALERLDIRVENGRLLIGNRERGGWFNWNRGSTGRATIRVMTPALAEATLSGSGTIHIGQVRGTGFAGSISGSGSMRIDAIDVREARFDIAGSGDLAARGRAGATRLRIAGSGDADLSGFETRTASIGISGSGDAAIRATDRVEANISGSGDVRVTGPARCTSNTRGSGRVRCEG